MRDLLLLVVLLGAMPFALARPVLAAAIYIVISVGSFHKLAFGFAAQFPWAAIYFAVLLISVMFSAKASFALGLKRYAVFLPFLLVVTLSTLVHHAQPWSLDRFLYFVKIQAALVLTLASIRSRKDLLWILSALVASVAFHAVKGAYSVLNVFTSKGISGPPDSMIADNNHFAVALVMCLPLLVYFARHVDRALGGVCRLSGRLHGHLVAWRHRDTPCSGFSGGLHVEGVSLAIAGHRTSRINLDLVCLAGAIP